MKITSKNRLLLLVVCILIFVVAFELLLYKYVSQTSTSFPRPTSKPFVIALPRQTINPVPTPSPTPKPLTFSDMNNLYGPCVHLPVIFYHHIQDPAIAKAGGYQSLNVNIDAFKNQMAYLKKRGYNTVNVSSLINFFDGGTAVPANSILLTFDDGYEDFYTNAYPILRDSGFQATMFLPTGLLANSGYLTWDQVKEMAGSGLLYFANHTWSHYPATGTPSKVRTEITLADSQLNTYGLNSLKVFAYPYGTAPAWTQTYLGSIDYKLAFSTNIGSTLCKQQRFALPRIRIGNATLSAYGF